MTTRRGIRASASAAANIDPAAEQADLDAFWDAFYSSPHPELESPSDFGRFCAAQLDRGASIFELGCGNGRDAMYFARLGFRVLACDRSQPAIDHLQERVAAERNLRHEPVLMAVPFEELSDIAPVDSVYSRFTLHAVPQDIASAALQWSARNLRVGGRIYIEARTVNGEPYGVGVPVERDAFLQDGHYRRFLRRDELEDELRGLGYTIESSVEGRGMARFGTEDPVVLRVVAAKA